MCTYNLHKLEPVSIKLRQTFQFNTSTLALSTPNQSFCTFQKHPFTSIRTLFEFNNEHTRISTITSTTITTTHLVSKGMPTDHNGLLPGGHNARDVAADDGLSEHCASQNVPDGSIGGLPHLLQLELCKGVVLSSQ